MITNEEDGIKEELQRYGIIANYYSENPYRIYPNEKYLQMIVKRLGDIEENFFPSLKNPNIMILNRFLNKYK